MKINLTKNEYINIDKDHREGEEAQKNIYFMKKENKYQRDNKEYINGNLIWEIKNINMSYNST